MGCRALDQWRLLTVVHASLLSGIEASVWLFFLLFTSFDIVFIGLVYLLASLVSHDTGEVLVRKLNNVSFHACHESLWYKGISILCF